MGDDKKLVLNEKEVNDIVESLEIVLRLLEKKGNKDMPTTILKSVIEYIEKKST